eukprot:2618594-Amphidinium_carterae.1
MGVSLTERRPTTQPTLLYLVADYDGQALEHRSCSRGGWGIETFGKESHGCKCKNTPKQLGTTLGGVGYHFGGQGIHGRSAVS